MSETLELTPQEVQSRLAEPEGAVLIDVREPEDSGCQREESCAATYKELGRNAWWAEVRLKSGQLGWVDMDRAAFDGVCSLEAQPSEPGSYY